MYDNADFSQSREFILNVSKRRRESRQFLIKFVYTSQKIILINLIIINNNIVNKKFSNFKGLIKNYVVAYN